MTEIDSRAGRRVVNVHATPFHEYDLEGPIQPEMSWLPVSYDRATGQGCYLMRMQPGAVTIAHDHLGMEEFLIIDGELIDDDGAVFRGGRFRQLRGRHAPQLAHRDRLHDRRLRMAAAAVVAVRRSRPTRSGGCASRSTTPSARAG